MNDTPHAHGPEAERLRRDRDQARQELSHTVAELTDKADVKARAEEKLHEVKARSENTLHDATDAVRRRPVPAATVVAAVSSAVLVWWVLRRRKA